MTGTSRQALVIGASRGLGLGLVRELLAHGWDVTATERRRSEALHALRDEAGDRLSLDTVDVDRPEQVDELRRRLGDRRFDLLFVNAGVLGSGSKTISEITHEQFVREMTTNAFSPVRLADVMRELVAPGGTIGFMSSQLASITNNTSGGNELYRASKAALNMLVRSFFARLPAGSATVLLLHPGWVRTEMGGPNADIDVETSTRGLAEVIDARHGRGGLAFLDYQGRELPW